ncbi:elongator complex protein 4 [Cladophialophora psammophila CBS 110553]|uniref:Elongator complex protein 4 n=1 Tax=Cladophialophora psammophila CBS 110553 TaxID=1182543 RepID=W9X8H0_9EURO|nr:elongator complex protein 4 [Cladophialophora psammophila CBS 110553]EXJ76772.1 elongator complex protein 4 [Cladophialophora psammophila CBS 110553]
MSFRKRNVGLSGSARSEGPAQTNSKDRIQLPGVRPSPVDGRPTTSTGTASLDALLAGHSGLVLGSTILIEESGTTDFAGALLRFYAAEGLLQGHHVHVLALPEQWGRELPGVFGESEKKETTPAETERMKIAWRYESLGQFGAGATTARERPQPTVGQPGPNGGAAQGPPIAFCHTFDLTKRLVHPAGSQMDFIQLEMNPTHSPFASTLERLHASVANSTPDTVHRIVIPSLLSPALYPPWSSQPQNILQFLQSLRALFAAYSNRLTALMSLPLSLYPRSSGLVRWVELLNDGVLELSPFPHSAEGDTTPSRGPSGAVEEPPQGLLQVHRLPMLHDRGSGVGTSETDWTFTLSRRKFTIKPFNLPPVEGDTGAQQAAGQEQKGKKADMEF